MKGTRWGLQGQCHHRGTCPGPHQVPPGAPGLWPQQGCRDHKWLANGFQLATVLEKQEDTVGLLQLLFTLSFKPSYPFENIF